MFPQELNTLCERYLLESLNLVRVLDLYILEVEWHPSPLTEVVKFEFLTQAQEPLSLDSELIDSLK